MNSGPIRLAHISDTHLGFEAYNNRTPTGINSRGRDVAKSFQTAVTQIKEGKYPLIIHSGDLTDKPHVPNKYLAVLKKLVLALAEPHTNHYIPQIIVIAGNHDQPLDKTEVVHLEIALEGFAGIHVVSDDYQQITFDPVRDRCDPVLENVVVHAISHDQLKDTKLVDTINPTKNRVNILTAHGVAEGSTLFTRAKGREFPITKELLNKDWDYVALGHWHVQGPVKVDGTVRNNIWYAGSTDTMMFRDVKGNECDTRGWLDVSLDPTTKTPTLAVAPKTFPVRRHVKIGPVNLKDIPVNDILEELQTHIKKRDIDDAVVQLQVTGISSNTWGLVDHEALSRTAKTAFHFETQNKTVKTGLDNTDETVTEIDVENDGELKTLLQTNAAKTVTEDDVERIAQLAASLIRRSLIETWDKENNNNEPAENENVDPLTDTQTNLIEQRTEND